MSNPERLLPHHLGEELPSEETEESKKEKRPPEEAEQQPEQPEEEKEKKSGRALYQERQEALNQAEDLDSLLRAEWKAKHEGKDAPKGINLALRYIESFRRTVKEAQDLRKVIRYGKSSSEKSAALAAYTEKKKEIDEYLDKGLSFEAAYREYLKEQGEYFEFARDMEEMSHLEGLLQEPAFQDTALNEKLDRKSSARVEAVMQEVETIEKPETEEALAVLETVFAKGSKEYEQAKAELLGEAKEGGEETLTKEERFERAKAKLSGKGERPRSKKEVQRRIAELREKVQELWENPMVRYFWNTREMDNMLEDFAEGEDVIETQSVIRALNKLHEWEGEHKRTTIGGVLVGPPGVGKTTLTRHYLQEKDRDYVYLDLSEEVTRYMLYGSKAIEFRDPTEYYQKLAENIGSLDEEGMKRFIEEHHEVVKNTFRVSDKEATAVLVNQIAEELEKGKGQVEDKALAGKLEEAKKHMEGLSKTAFRRELAGQFSHLASRNGWRDGVIISALRRGDNIIFDEFNKNKNWSLIYGLMTAKPGENWYFADNDEEIKVPEDWRMYFTANIGVKHGVYSVPEAFASRAAGKTMEVNYPPRSEEMKVALCSLANPEGDLLRSPDDLAKLYVLMNEVFPKVRKFTENKPQIIPISYRTVRDIGEKLVQYSDPKTGKPVYQPSGKSFDEALYEVMVGSYSVYEDKTIPKEIVQMCTNVGLLLDDSVREKVEGWIGKEAFDEKQKTFGVRKEDFREIVKKIQGITRDVSELPMPEQRKI